MPVMRTTSRGYGTQSGVMATSWSVASRCSTKPPAKKTAMAMRMTARPLGFVMRGVLLVELQVRRLRQCEVVLDLIAHQRVELGRRQRQWLDALFRQLLLHVGLPEDFGDLGMQP